jgi:microcin C transport system permease protein
MTNTHIFLVLIILLLFDPIRLGIYRLILKLFELFPHIVAGLFLFIIRLPWFIRDLYIAVKEYFTSPIFQKRARKFKSLKRGYYSFLLIVFVYLLSFLLPIFVTNQAWYVNYEGKHYFPAVRGFFQYYFEDFINAKWVYFENEFGLEGESPVCFRTLHGVFKEQRLKDPNCGNFVIRAPYPYSPNESVLREYEVRPPHRPDRKHWFGTDDRGRDVFARLAYGFNISMSFALIVVFFAYLIGVSIGGFLGYYGGTFDIIMQRFVEIWSAIPFLFTVMIVVSIFEKPSMLLLVTLIAMFGWMGMTYYIRGEFLREKAKDYVAAAISIGVRDHTIIFKHILPNALTPVISFLPFAIVGNISALVSLDFLGFGLPAPTPSWGELMSQGMANLRIAPWLSFAPLGALFLTLLLVSFVGEAIREAFDPKQYSRLR